MSLVITKELVNECRRIGYLKYVALEAVNQLESKDKKIAELEEERRWRKFPDEKPTEEMEDL